MKRLLALTTVLALGGCSSVPTPPPEPARSFTGKSEKAAVGAPMVDNLSTTVRIDPMTHQSRVEGVRAQLVYKGFAPPAVGKNVIRVRYEEHRVVNGIQAETPDHLADIQLDLDKGQVLTMKGWQIGVVEATPSSIEFVATWSPPAP